MSIAKGVSGDFKEEDMLKLQRVYYGMVAEADAMLGSVWDTLNKKGYNLMNTYVIYISDHGELKFEHRQVYKASMFEGSVRVPMQIAGPGIKRNQHITSHLVSLVDVFPTLLDMAQEANSKTYYGLNGKSLLPAAGGNSVAPYSMRLAQGKDNRDMVISQYNWVEANTGVFMVRSGPWKYMAYGHTYQAYKNYQPQLYNVAEDPEELRDVAWKHPEVVAELDAKLRQELDPDHVDKKVMQDDFARLQGRYSSSPQFLSETNTNEMLKLVPHDYALQFKGWLEEAANLFGLAESAPAKLLRGAAARRI